MPHLRLLGAREVAPDVPPDVPLAPHHILIPRWLINGYEARLVTWSDREWRRLRSRPATAQPYLDGSFVNLRIGDPP